MTIKRGDVFFADLSPEGGLCLVLISQTNVGNNFSPTVIAIPIKSKTDETTSSPHVLIPAEKIGIAKDSLVMLAQVRTLDKHRLKEKIGHLDKDMMKQVQKALEESLGLKQPQDTMV